MPPPTSRSCATLAGLNQEARDIILIALETGARQSDIHDVPPEDIHAWDPIPYIEIQHVEADEDEGTEGREVKNIHSVRKMPLVGVALAAARRKPQGFPRYRGKADFSATANKYFRENGLFPTPKHTLGGLRHSWESRLRAEGLHQDDRVEMMGHSVKSERNRELYGDEMPLEVKAKIATLVYFDPPGMTAHDAIALKAERAKARRELRALWRRHQF